MIFRRPTNSRLLDRIANLSLPCRLGFASEHRYPWNLDKLFPNRQAKVSLVGYGSLLNVISARRSFSDETIAFSRPVVVLGAKRIYEYIMSPNGRRVYGEETGNGGYGVLNARLSDDADDWFNGREFLLGVEEFEALLPRESAYDLVPAWTMSWNPNHVEPHLSYFLSCRRDWFGGRQIIQNDLLPHPKYHAVCEEGCRSVSEEFLDAFRASTWVCNERMNQVDDPPIGTPPPKTPPSNSRSESSLADDPL